MSSANSFNLEGTKICQFGKGLSSFHCYGCLCGWCGARPDSTKQAAEPYSSVGSVKGSRTEGRWFDPWLGRCSFTGLMIIIATGFIPLTAVHCFDNGYVGKQPSAWKEYCVEY